MKVHIHCSASNITAYMSFAYFQQNNSGAHPGQPEACECCPGCTYNVSLVPRPNTRTCKDGSGEVGTETFELRRIFKGWIWLVDGLDGVPNTEIVFLCVSSAVQHVELAFMACRSKLRVNSWKGARYVCGGGCLPFVFDTASGQEEREPRTRF